MSSDPTSTPPAAAATAGTPRDAVLTLGGHALGIMGLLTLMAYTGPGAPPDAILPAVAVAVATAATARLARRAASPHPRPGVRVTAGVAGLVLGGLGTWSAVSSWPVLAGSGSATWALAAALLAASTAVLPTLAPRPPAPSPSSPAPVGPPDTSAG